MSSGVTEFFSDLPILPYCRSTGSPRACSRRRLLDLGRFDEHAALVGERIGLDVPLVDEPLERLGRADMAEVVEHLVPEAAVEQVEHRVLDAADIEVDAPFFG